MWRDIKFEMQGITFYLPIIDNIIFIEGDSGSGKTFFFKMLIDYVAAGKNLENVNEGRIELIDYKSSRNAIEAVLRTKNTIICIDNADRILRDKWIAKAIASNEDNVFIIAGRGSYGLEKTPFNTLVCSFNKETKIFTFEGEEQ